MNPSKDDESYNNDGLDRAEMRRRRDEDGHQAGGDTDDLTSQMKLMALGTQQSTFECMDSSTVQMWAAWCVRSALTTTSTRTMLSTSKKTVAEYGSWWDHAQDHDVQSSVFAEADSDNTDVGTKLRGEHADDFLSHKTERLTDYEWKSAEVTLFKEFPSHIEKYMAKRADSVEWVFIILNHLVHQ